MDPKLSYRLAKAPRSLPVPGTRSGTTQTGTCRHADPGERFLHMIETLFGLGRDGFIKSKGMPNLLQLSVFDCAFSHVFNGCRVYRRGLPLLSVGYSCLAADRRRVGSEVGHPMWGGREHREVQP